MNHSVKKKKSKRQSEAQQQLQHAVSFRPAHTSVHRFPAPCIRQRADSTHGHAGQSQAACAVDSGCGLAVCFNFSFAPWDGEPGLPTVFISVQSLGNKRFVQMFPGLPIDSSPVSVVGAATRVRSHDSP